MPFSHIHRGPKNECDGLREVIFSAFIPDSDYLDTAHQMFEIGHAEDFFGLYSPEWTEAVIKNVEMNFNIAGQYDSKTEKSRMISKMTQILRNGGFSAWSKGTAKKIVEEMRKKKARAMESREYSPD